jgi:hypothetical protein
LIYQNAAAMTVYRYNCKNRQDRHFNTTGREKNPNMVKFYATSLEHADGYKYIYNRAGEVIYECELETADLSGVKLFDMEANAPQLITYKNYITEKADEQRPMILKLISEEKRKNQRAYFEQSLANLEKDLHQTLVMHQFQFLSNYERQTELINELRALGFGGYFTTKEVAVF